MASKSPFKGGSFVQPSNNVPQLPTLEGLKQWLKQQLGDLLGLETVIDVVDYILSMDNEDEIRTYITGLLGTNKKVTRFMESFFSQWKATPRQRVIEAPGESKVYIKNKSEAEPEQKKKKPKQKANQQIQEEKIDGFKVAKPKPKAKQKTDNFSIAGRHICECQATEHALLGNCLNCGKIICVQEGPGPCLFCAIESREEEASSVEVADSSDKTIESLAKALEHKDKLLEYDRTSAKRTVVYDDQSDYYSMNQWITPEERERLKKQHEDEIRKKQEDKRKTKITFDFAGRKVIVKEDDSTPTKENYTEVSHNVATNLTTVAPTFIPSRPKQADKDHPKKEKTASANRIQHQYFEDDL